MILGLLYILLVLFINKASSFYIAHMCSNSDCVAEIKRRNYTTGEAAGVAYTRGERSEYKFPAIAIIGDSTINAKYTWLQFINKTQTIDFVKFYGAGCEIFQRHLSKDKDAIDKADILLWNFGLHALHLRPCREGPYHR